MSGKKIVVLQGIGEGGDEFFLNKLESHLSATSQRTSHSVHHVDFGHGKNADAARAELTTLLSSGAVSSFLFPSLFDQVRGGKKSDIFVPEVIAAVCSFVANGGVVVFFGGDVDVSLLGRVFNKKDWKYAEYRATSWELFQEAVASVFPSSLSACLPRGYSTKTTTILTSDPKERLYIEARSDLERNDALWAWFAYGYGRVFMCGDANFEKETLQVVGIICEYAAQTQKGN